jgi:photosystem II stability/assembly factor-like uncharacterized protein
MKKITQQILFASAMILSGSIQAQWTQMGGGLSTGANFTDFYAVDSNVIYVGGVNGFLKKTSDGTNWEYARNGMPNSFRIFSLHCTDANTCFASGLNEDNNTSGFWTTTDGAASWQASPNPVAISDIFFVNQNVGYASNNGYGVYKTTNSGNDWEAVFPPLQSISSIEEIYFTSEEVGYIVGNYFPIIVEDITKAKIMKTIDGGATWTTVYTSDVEYSTLIDVTFVSADLGFACGDNGNLLKTTDGGENWLDISIAGDETRTYNGIAFANHYTGLISVNGGEVRRTIDGANTWIEEILPNLGGIVRMPHKNKGYILESSGGLYESSVPGDQITNSITEILANNTVQIYPNPAQDFILIKAEGSYSYSIVDMSGKKVRSSDSEVDAISVNVQNLESGAYFIHITGQSGAEVHSFIKQ